MNMNKPPDETLKQGRNRSWLLVKFACFICTDFPKNRLFWLEHGYFFVAFQISSTTRGEGGWMSLHSHPHTFTRILLMSRLLPITANIWTLKDWNTSTSKWYVYLSGKHTLFDWSRWHWYQNKNESLSSLFQRLRLIKGECHLFQLPRTIYFNNCTSFGLYSAIWRSIYNKGRYKF